MNATVIRAVKSKQNPLAFSGVVLFLAVNILFSYYYVSYTGSYEIHTAGFYMFVSGVLYFIAVITFIQFIFFKELTYVYYVLYVLANLCYFTLIYSSNPDIAEKFPFWFTKVRYNLSLSLLCAGYLLYVLFAISFLGLKGKDELVYKWLFRFSRIYFIIFIFSVLLSLLPASSKIGNSIKTLLLVACMPMGIISILLVYFRIKNNIARILCIGSLCFFTGSVLGFLFSTGLLQYPFAKAPFNQWVFYTEAGTLLEVVLFSSSFAYRNKILADEERRAQEIAALEIEKNKQKEKKLQIIRDEIARDLHDDIGASLSNINILNELAKRNSGNPLKVGEYLNKASEDIQDISESLSDIVWNINPKYDSTAHLFVKMRRYAADMMDGKNIEYDLRLPVPGEEINLDMEKRRNFYLVFKEAINNMIKYSEATKAAVIVERKGNNLFLLVKDDGKGFDPDKILAGNGLINMQKRTADIGGVINILSSPGMGTAVQLQLPIT